MSDNKRQKMIFVNNTKITNKTEQETLEKLSSTYTNAIFFTERTYTDDPSSSQIETDNNIYIGGKEYVPVRGVDPNCSAISVCDKLFTMSLDSNTGRLQFGVYDAISDITLYKIFYTFEYNDDELSIYDFSNFDPNNINVSEDTSGIYANGTYPNDRYNLFNERSFSHDNDNELANTICFMLKFSANEKSINPIYEGPSINLFYYNNDEKFYLNKYISEFKTSISEVNKTNHKMVYNTKINQNYISYIPYYFKLNEFIKLGGQPIYGEYIYDKQTIQFKIDQAGNNRLSISSSPLITNFELVEIPEIPATSASADYLSYAPSKNITSKQFVDGELVAITGIDLTKIILQVIPDRSIYGERNQYNNLMDNLSYELNNIKLTFTSSNMHFTLSSTSDNALDPQIAYDSTNNTITFIDGRHINITINGITTDGVVNSVPLKNYTVTMTYDSFSETFKNDDTLTDGQVNISNFKINKLDDTYLAFFYQSNGTPSDAILLSEINTRLNDSTCNEIYTSVSHVQRDQEPKYTIDINTYNTFMLIVDSNLISGDDALNDYRPQLLDAGISEIIDPLPFGYTSDETHRRITDSTDLEDIRSYDIYYITSQINEINDANPEIIEDGEWVLTIGQ